MTERETLKLAISENNLHQVSGRMKRLRPSQIDGEQLIREVEINMPQCGARHAQ